MPILVRRQAGEKTESKEEGGKGQGRKGTRKKRKRKV